MCNNKLCPIYDVCDKSKEQVKFCAQTEVALNENDIKEDWTELDNSQIHPFKLLCA